MTEPGWTEDLEGTIDNPVSTGDRHLLIVDVDNQHLYEIYQPYRNATGAPQTMPNGTVLQPGSFYCASAAFWDMKTNNTRPDGWTSSDAAGLQVLPGLVQYDEVMGPDPITHAHRITLNGARASPRSTCGPRPTPPAARARRILRLAPDCASRPRRTSRSPGRTRGKSCRR